jgi:hypothetical protein
MKAGLEQWDEGWQGISLGLSNDEIDHLILLLKQIKADNDQHFHISSDFKGAPSLGGIEIYVNDQSQDDNMYFSSLAKSTGDEI